MQYLFIDNLEIQDSTATTELTPEGKTQPPWLRFLKNKKTTLAPGTDSGPSSAPAKKGWKEGNKGVNSERAVDEASNNGFPEPAPQLSEMDQLANWLGIYLQPSRNILAQDRQQNPYSLYDEMYLDWMKRDLGSAPGELSGSNNYGSGDVAVNPLQNPWLAAPQPPLEVVAAAPPQQPLTYGYPAVSWPYGIGYSPFFPSLAGLKLQKVMAQAQVDAALAALNITTTPKPLKLKLKITVPGNTDMTQLGQMTAGFASSLPVGSTYEVV